jgi:hypothetical protein
MSRAILEYAQVCETEKRAVDTLIANLTRTGLRCHSVPELTGELDQIDGLIEIGSILRTDSEGPREGNAT